MPRPAIFFDRDGVLNEDIGYVNRPQDCQFLTGAAEAVRLAEENGYARIIVTNQAGIGRGYYSDQAFHDFMAWFLAEFEAKGARFTAYYYCPYHPVFGLAGWRQESEDRKPGPGMLLRAARDHDLDLSRSVLIGDRQGDIDAAGRAGVTGIRFRGGDLSSVLEGVFAGLRQGEKDSLAVTKKRLGAQGGR